MKRVLLLSIDGMHAVDFYNCANGVTGVNGGQPFCPNLAALGQTGLTYVGASTSKPSDSFPGLMTIVTGGTPKTMGVYYDVAYDRSLLMDLRREFRFEGPDFRPFKDGKEFKFEMYPENRRELDNLGKALKKEKEGDAPGAAQGALKTRRQQRFYNRERCRLSLI